VELLLRLVTGPGGGEDVALTVDKEHTVAEAIQALAEFSEVPARDVLSVSRSSGWEQFRADQPMGDVGLVSGDKVAIGSIADQRPHRRGTGIIRLAVTSGPNAAQSFELGVGEHSLGRSGDATVTLDDPMISRHHVSLVVSEDASVRLHPNLEAANKVRLNGAAITESVDLGPIDVVQIGASRLRVRDAVEPEPRARDFFGGVPFHRTPYFRTPIPARAFDAIGKLPIKPTPKRFQVITALSPMIMGVSMALMLGSYRYLMMAVFSPLIAIGNWWDQRKQGGIQYDESVVKFGEVLETRRAEIVQARQTERMHRVLNSPDLELLARRADSQHNELWQRDRDAEDFLTLRVGVGEGEALLTIKPESRGDDEFLAQAATAFENATVLPDVPIAIPLAQLGVVGLVGEPAEATELAASLLLQACCLHSPEDLVVLGALGDGRGLLDWLKWLPHTRASSSPIGGDQLVGDVESADRLIRTVAKVAEARVSSRDSKLDRRWPWLVVAIDQQLEPDASVVSRLLDLCPAAGMSVIWLAESHTRVPRQANAVIELKPLRTAELSELRFVDVDQPDQMLDPERLRSDVAAGVAQSLAPLRDATAANAVTAIPRTVPLFASLGVSSMSPEWIAEQWSLDRGYSLPAPIGMTDSGPISLDLVAHGPHGLIGGTSGAGKSELVQSLVVNLAAFNSPDRINFLFVDYKGGALSEMFKDIPHTVGAVTNLDQLLALRALTSLTAELDRRMELFKGRAPDIKDMIAKFPDEAPPSLVIVVDEFAALVRELPEFVDGIVSIAERGRSLGIHLIMSTQRPSGAINENIQQNTNLRIALRMLDSGESNNVIGAPDAAMIPGPLKGRGLARLGPGELIPFQSAWSGAPLLAEEGPPPASVESFVVGPVARRKGSQSATASVTAAPNRTQLDATIESIIAATEQLGLTRGRAPWKETLSSFISLNELLDDDRSRAFDVLGSKVTVGIIDDPAAQDQYPGGIDFENEGATVIFGNSGSGKSTLLKTIAASAAMRDSENGGGGLTIFALDFASRELGLLSRLPQTSAVVTGDDLEGVTRVLALLEGQVESRRAALSAATTNGDLPPEHVSILLLLDGYENLVQACETGARGMQRWLDITNRLIIEGRTYGINVVFTASRRAAVRSSVMSSISSRYVLRQSEDGGYVELGIPSKMAKGLELRPGQGFNGDNQSMQFAMVADLTNDGLLDDRAALIALGSGLIGGVAPELVTHVLPVEIPALDLKPGHQDGIADKHVRIGIADQTLLPVDLDLTFNNVAVIGPPRSGKSTALVTIGRQLIAAGMQVSVAGPHGSRLAGLNGVTSSAFGRLADLIPFFEELAATIETFPGVERALLYDDADLVDDRKMYESAQKILDGGVRYIGSTSGLRGMASNPFFGELKNARTQLVLQPVDSREIVELTNVPADLRPGTAMPAGRGVLVADRSARVLQTSSDEVHGFAAELQPPTISLTPMPERRPLSRSRLDRTSTVPSLVEEASVLPDAPRVPLDAAIRPVVEQPVAESLTADAYRAQAPAAEPELAVAAMPPPPIDPVEPLVIKVEAMVDPTTRMTPTRVVPPVGAPPAYQAHLFDLVLENGERVRLDQPTVVGRRPGDCTPASALTIADASISARHLLLDPSSADLCIVDQNSRNGTILRNANGAHSLKPGVPCPLVDGDEIHVGDLVLRVAQAVAING